MRTKEVSQREIWGNAIGCGTALASQGFCQLCSLSVGCFSGRFSRRNYTSESFCKERKKRNLSARLQVVKVHLQELSHLALPGYVSWSVWGHSGRQTPHALLFILSASLHCGHCPPSCAVHFILPLHFHHFWV